MTHSNLANSFNAHCKSTKLLFLEVTESEINYTCWVPFKIASMESISFMRPAGLLIASWNYEITWKMKKYIYFIRGLHWCPHSCIAEIYYKRRLTKYGDFNKEKNREKGEIPML